MNNKKRIYIIFGIAIFLFVFSFVFAAVAEILQENGYGDYWSPLIGLIGLFLFMLIAVVLLFSQLKDAFEIDFKDITNQLDKMEPYIEKGIEPLKIHQKHHAYHRGADY